MKLIELEELINQFKIIKSDLVYLRGNNIFGFDYSHTIVKETSFCNPNSYLLVIQIKDWLDLFKQLKESNTKYENKVIDEIQGDYISYKGKNYYYKSSFIISELDRKISTIHNIMNSIKPVEFIEDVKSDTNFNTTLDKEFKSDCGVYLYRVKEYVMTIYKTLLGITSKDNVSLNIYNYSDLYFLSKYVLYNKKQSISIYLNLRKLP